jgi:hypothetical protein
MKILLAALALSFGVALNLTAQAPCAFSTTNASITETCGNVGIGTTQTFRPLSFANGTGEKLSLYANSSTAQDYYGFGIAGAELQYQVPATAHHSFFVGTSEKVRIDGSGNVGIGALVPGARLQVGVPASSIAGALIYGTITNLTASSNVPFYRSISAQHSSTWAFGTEDNDKFGIWRQPNGGGWGEFLTVNSTGNIGIGTSSPGALLHLMKSAPGSLGPELRLENSGNAVGDISALTFSDNSAARAQIRSTIESSPWYGTLEFLTGIYTPTEKMRITGDGKVGIGTAAPNAALDVLGNQAIIRQPGGGANLQLGDISGNSTSYFTFANSNSATNWRITSNNNIPGGLEFMPSTAGGGNTYTASAMAITNAANVGIGTNSPSARLDVAGNGHFSGSVVVDGNLAAKYQDVAEWVPVAEEMPAGTVVVVSGTSSNTVGPSRSSYDTRVAGVVSAQPGLTLGEGSSSKAKIATTGRVRVRVDATKGAIALGDLLVTSDKPGMAMKSDPLDLGGVKIHRPGTLIGKALEPLPAGEGEILVLLSLQ